MAGETDQAAKNISELGLLARKVDDRSMLKSAALMMSELRFWQGRILEAIRSYEETMGDVEEFGDDDKTLKDSALVGWCYVMSGRIARGLGMINAVRAKASLVNLPRGGVRHGRPGRSTRCSKRER